jgi:threonyl-tRNA synthetase
MDIQAAIDWARQSGQTYKLELLEDLKNKGSTSVKEEDFGDSVDKVTFYTLGDFTDLCRGPHLADSGQAGAFKLTRVSGAYWRGDEKRPQMQRIYGVAFDTDKELQEYLSRQEEAKQRDHRKIGKELDLFTFSELVGAGLPLFTPRGTVLRDSLADFSNELREKYGFQRVWTPHITKKDLYEKSGHWSKFGEELFLVKSQETSDDFVIKPMNCPHHTRIYESSLRSYRDLPVRYLETTTVYRDEKSGELGGLSRVRAITQDDSHVFCRPDQIEAEIHSLMAAASELYGKLNMELKVRLSYRDDSDSYLGEKSQWDNAQKQLKSAVKSAGMNYFEQDGEAAFYGPKIDFMATDAIGREHQVATVQLDFVQPARFELEYLDENGEKQTPVMIHCALLGSIERFLSVFIEHTSGRFPVWCAPEQLRVIKVKDDPAVDRLVADLMERAQQNGVRVTLDDSNNSVGKKIRNAEVHKVPYTVVVGEKEVESAQLPIRIRSDIVVKNTTATLGIDELIKKIVVEITTRAIKSTL